MKFCKTCGNILVVKDLENGRMLFCKTCNVTFPMTENIIIESKQNSEKHVIVLDEDKHSEFPITKVLCPKCEEIVEAYWALQQTRAADEPPTRFYRCKKCNWIWREYS